MTAINLPKTGTEALDVKRDEHVAQIIASNGGVVTYALEVYVVSAPGATAVRATADGMGKGADDTFTADEITAMADQIALWDFYGVRGVVTRLREASSAIA